MVSAMKSMTPDIGSHCDCGLLLHCLSGCCSLEPPLRPENLQPWFCQLVPKMVRQHCLSSNDCYKDAREDLGRQGFEPPRFFANESKSTMLSDALQRTHAHRVFTVECNASGRSRALKQRICGIFRSIHIQDARVPLLWNKLQLLHGLLQWLGPIPGRPGSRSCCFCFWDRLGTHADRVQHLCSYLQHLCCLLATAH